MKIFKKIPLVVVAMLCFIVFTGFKSDEDDKVYVYDDADIILDSDEEALTEKCQKASEECQITIAIATTYDAEGFSSREYAENMIIKENLGYEDDKIDKSVVLFLIDLDNRETYIATSGLGILFVDDDNIEEILDQVYMYIRNDYSTSCSAFVDKTVEVIAYNQLEYGEEYLEDWENYDGNYADFYNEYVKEQEHNIFYRLKNPVVCIIIALIIGTVSVVIMSINNKSRMTVSGIDYMDRHNTKMHIHTDRYIRTTTQKIRINTSSGGGGGGGSHGGSFHSSGGGRSFGGGGRRL
jgi:uncharacterized protein